MAEVKRLHFTTTAQGALNCIEHEDGGFVHYSDYAALEQDIASLKLSSTAREVYWNLLEKAGKEKVALERRLRIAERALKNARDYANDLRMNFIGSTDDSVGDYLVDAERDIDAEQKVGE